MIIEVVAARDNGRGNFINYLSYFWGAHWLGRYVIAVRPPTTTIELFSTTL